MTRPESPPVASVLPHDGNMVLLSRIVAHDDRETICESDPPALGPFRSDGRVGAWVGVEVMAQCIAAHAGLLARERGERPQIGFLLGSRRIRFHKPWLEGVLGVSARWKWGEGDGLASFECRLWEDVGGQAVAEGRINCFLPPGGDLSSRGHESKSPRHRR